LKVKILLTDDRYYKKIVKNLDEHIKEITFSRRPMINSAVDDLIRGGGKKLRPFLMFLAASFGDYDKNTMLDLGAGIEILHMASLVHDDIIDSASLRRGEKTARKKFGDKEAVFIGDYLLTKTFDILFDHLDSKNLKKISKIVRLICEGEIEQAEKRYDFSLNIKDYFKRIRHKTALLFALSCYIGAYVSGVRGKKLNTLYKLGMEIGMAFQIQDDILDFEGNQAETGKKMAKDLKEGIITLPVIFLLKDDKYKKKYSSLFKNEIPNNNKQIISSGDFSTDSYLEKKFELKPEDELLEELMRDVKKSSAIDQSREILIKFIERVNRYLDDLPENRAKSKLEKLIDLQIKRKF